MNQKGMVHGIVFVLVIVVGFGFALGWPQYAKYKEVSHAKEALSMARNLAQAQQTYAAEHDGQYTQDWTAFGLPLTCPQVTKEGVNTLECEYYDFYMQDGQIYARHKQIAKWLTVDIASGKADCSHETKSVAGAKICEKLSL